MHVLARNFLKMAASASYRTLEYYYVSEPDDDLLCPICLEVARDPLQHEACGKLFCKECIEEHGKDQPCPHCNTEGLKFYQDKIGKTLVSRGHTLIHRKRLWWTDDGQFVLHSQQAAH